MKRFVILLLTAVLALTMPLSALAAGQIEVTEDISVSDDYDWTRFKGQNVTLNVYNWGEYISNGSDDSVDVVAAFEKLTGIKVNYTTSTPTSPSTPSSNPARPTTMSSSRRTTWSPR